ncbi:hematopoietic SH2 domain-containing protein homolog [Anarrhichthys ocellatus]|uniref:hematopoietic SH2 domain-containing protein homolog n=1 Tax=Anarrhichthys ocellatus TaxID=433405 RepID=UPI0012EDF393|nr:hematopoietic SH2 domain-containing protein [Anarrhichthys ocellatus]
MMERSQSSQGQHDAITWFTESQRRLVIRNGIIPEWFHGIISRNVAEELLMSKPSGYFLIRVSESRIGYSLSYRAEDHCRHFMIDAVEDGHYIILGENRSHRSLQDMVDFHRRTPIMPFSVVLTVPCEQTSNDKSDYADLLFPQRHPNPNTSWLPTNPLHPSIGHPTSQEQIPPALPYRPNDLKNAAVRYPNNLYPNLEAEIPRVLFPLPVLPATRNRCTANNPPSNQPPQVPARTSVPPLKQHQACIKTVSESPHTPTATEHPLSGNIQFAKNQEAKMSVVSNLKNLKKKFQKKRSTSHKYAEVNMEATERSGNAGNEYQYITGQQTANAPPLSYTCTDVRLTDGELPYEYLPPPPFAPGF